LPWCVISTESSLPVPAADSGPDLVHVGVCLVSIASPDRPLLISLSPPVVTWCPVVCAMWWATVWFW